MQDITAFINSNVTEFIAGLAGAFLILLVYCIYLSRKLSKGLRKRDRRLPGESAAEILDSLDKHSRELAAIRDVTSSLSSRLDVQDDKLKECLQKVGLVRFNAFDDVGGEQSFSLVLLDDKGNGVAVSSLYGRQDSRLYAKAITNADGERPLSDEEKSALQSALSGKKSAVEA